MTSDEIIELVDKNAIGFTMEEKRHFHRFFLSEYCSSFMSYGSIARKTGIRERSMVYRSIKIIQTTFDYWRTAHQINQLIRAELHLAPLKFYQWDTKSKKAKTIKS